jgi:hypothetical protein
LTLSLTEPAGPSPALSQAMRGGHIVDLISNASDVLAGGPFERLNAPVLQSMMLDHIDRHSNDPCACWKSNPDIFVMQSAEYRAAKNTPCPLYGAR